VGNGGPEVKHSQPTTPGQTLRGGEHGRRHWSDLRPRTRALIVVGGVIQFALLGAALADIRRRRPEELNGPRQLRVAVSFVNFIGPIAYFVLGRRKSVGS
jgi:hypothetical protein